MLQPVSLLLNTQLGGFPSTCFRYNACMSDVKTVRLTETVKAAG
jgi:hypothetical protein